MHSLSMAHNSSNTATDIPFTGMLNEGELSRDFQQPRSSSTPIHLLDDNSLLVIFSQCRPVIFDESEANDSDAMQILKGGEWDRERWWHRLVQVCRRWRYLALDSASHLRISIVCGRGTPVADMLAHFPPVPIIIDHFDDKYRDVTPEDQEAIIFALQHRDRVRRIRVMKPIPILQKLIVALDGEFPILDFLLIMHQRYHRPLIENITNLSLPETFRAPHLRHLLLVNFAIPIESPSLTTMLNLVTLSLSEIPSSAYFDPNALLQRLSLMLHLETLGIGHNPSRDVTDIERQLLRTPIMTGVTLPNLRWLAFRGSSVYLEALLPWITTPLLEKLQVYFFNRTMYSIPHLQQFMSTARNLRLKTARFTFSEDCLIVKSFPYKEAGMYTLDMELGGRQLDSQITSVAQVFHALKTVFSAVEDLTLKYSRHNISPEWNNEPDGTHWRELLGSFGKVKTLRVEYGVVKQVSRALEPGEGESPTGLLPELQELSYSTRGSSRDAFAVFIDASQKAGRPVTVVHF